MVLAGPLVWTTILIFLFQCSLRSKLVSVSFLQNRHSKLSLTAVSWLWSLLPVAQVTATLKQMLGVIVSLSRTPVFRLTPDEKIHRG